MKHKSWIYISGLTWLAVGVSLLYKGLRLIAEGILLPDSLSSRLQGLIGSPYQAGQALIAIGLLIGFAKGRWVLSKTVRRVVGRIESLSLPIRISDVYARPYWFLIGGMVLLGMSLRYLPLPIDGRGLIDVAIGSALLNGAMLYFRAARSVKPAPSHL